MMTLLDLPALAGVAHALQPMAASAAGTLISAAWEGVFLVACVALCLRFITGLSASARSVIWVSVFVLLLMQQVLPYMGVHAPAGVAPQSAQFQLGLAWCYAIGSIWLSLSLLRGTQLLLSGIRLRRLAVQAEAVEPGEALRPLLRVRTVVGKFRRSAELCASKQVERPSVLGFLRPRILVPPALLARLTEEELRQVVLHEMEHLRRGDDWTNLLQKLVLVIFPLNPALFWVERKLCAERELACDDRVLSSNCGRKAYAICLTHLAEYSMLRKSVSLALGAWERQSELVRRVHRILRRPRQTLGRGQTMILTAALMLVVVGVALRLERSPQLVGFTDASQPTPQIDNQAGIAASVSGMSFPSAGAAPHMQLTSAVMAQPLAMAPRTIQAINQSQQSAPLLATMRKNAVIRNGRRRRAPSPSLLVVTEWTETGAPVPLVWTVTRGNRASYAAIPTPSGWLLIQI